MTSGTLLNIGEKSQEALTRMLQEYVGAQSQNWNLRARMEAIDKAYARTTDNSANTRRARLAQQYGDSTKFQDVTVPLVMPQVESATTYQASVFLTGVPLFGWVSPPETATAALQYQAIVEENAVRGGWTREFMMFFRDCFKYNLGAVEVSWARQVSAAIETDMSFGNGRTGKPVEVIWTGNKVTRWDLYNSFWDLSCAPTELFQKGEFAGRNELYSRVGLKKFFAELPDKIIPNIKKAFESNSGASGITGAGFNIPQINPESFKRDTSSNGIDWVRWAGYLDRPDGEINYGNQYIVTTLYVRMIPQDFLLRVPSANTPQVWKLVFVNFKVLVYAERQTNAHNYIPVLFGQPNEDGLEYQTKSLAENAKPFQEISSALVNSTMAARRRALADRGIYNPLLVSEHHMNSDSPTAKIPMRPAGYNKNPAEAYYPIPFRDDTSAMAFQEVAQMEGMANNANGRNRVQQGQFVKGNKTQHEFDSVMANANGRDQTTAMLLEAQTFTPLKEIIKINTVQYQAGISIFSPTQKKVVKIDPVQLRKAFIAYKLTDGLVPTDKVMSAEEYAVAMQTIASSPQIGAAYNVGPMFSFLMKTRNVDLSPFEKSPEQQVYEQAVGAWQQAVAKALENPDLDPSKLPPQPKPADYGYTPGADPSKQGQQATPANLSAAAATRA